MKSKHFEKSAKPAAFGRNLERFSPKGLHPQLFIRNPALLKKTALPSQQPIVQVKRNTFEQLYDKIKALGEPTKPIDKPEEQVKVSKTKLKQKIKGLNWELALKTELKSRIPCVLYLETWENNKNKEEELGPTKYNIQDFKKPYNTSGVMMSKEPRFHNVLHKQNAHPGPGNYGPKGIPYVPLGDVARKKKYCMGKKTLMANQPRKPFQIGGDYLAPNVYFRGITPNTIQEFVHRKVSRRGPYDVFTGNRQARIRTGWLAQTEVFDVKSQPVGPLPTTTTMRNKGTTLMSHTARESRPTGRFVCETNAHSWAAKITPAIFYDKSDIQKSSFNVKNVPFNRSSRRFDVMTARRFFLDYDVCGPGRYDIKTTLGRQGPCRSVAPEPKNKKSKGKTEKK